METPEKYLSSLQKLNPDELAKLFFNIKGVKKADKGNFDDALECFSKAIDLPPKDSISYFNRASLRMYIGDVKGAMSDLKALESWDLTKILSWLYMIIHLVSVVILLK